MRRLKAGDYVLTSDGLTIGIDRVLVNQHTALSTRSALMMLHTSSGSVSLTPDHVLQVDHQFVPARHAHVGARLTSTHNKTVVILSISHGFGDVINPLTTSGTILAAGSATGRPIVAATHPEWIALSMINGIGSRLLPWSACNALSRLAPEGAQAYYDRLLEPLFAAGAADAIVGIKHNAWPWAILPLALLLDASLATGFAVFTLATHLAALAVAALGVQALRHHVTAKSVHHKPW